MAMGLCQNGALVLKRDEVGSESTGTRTLIKSETEISQSKH